MRCIYLSDLHLESQPFRGTLPGGDVLIVAGDLCHARCLDPARRDRYSVEQRDRARRFVDLATSRFPHVLMVAGNHEHYDGILEETVPCLRAGLPGVTVLDDEAVEVDGVRFIGTTLWSDFEGGSQDGLDRVRRRMGEFFFVKRRTATAEGTVALARFQPEHALALHRRSLAALRLQLDRAPARPTVVVSHHAPSLQGLNPRHAGNGLDGAYASNLDDLLSTLRNVPVWVHGHTHIRRVYRIGETEVRANCRGFEGKDPSAGSFKPTAFFEV